jgi:hypothetical protein
MVIPTRKALVEYLHLRAFTLRRPADVAPGTVARLQEDARALDRLAEVVRSFPKTTSAC